MICRGVLVSLSTLYQHLLELLREVANAQSMPFLTDFSLPADMTQFLGPSDAFLLTKQSAHFPHAKDHKEKQQRRKRSVKVKNQGQRRKLKEDLGVAIERGVKLFHCFVFYKKHLVQGSKMTLSWGRRLCLCLFCYIQCSLVHTVHRKSNVACKMLAYIYAYFT